MTQRTRVAVLGGDGRFRCDELADCEVRVFPAARYGGNGPLRRLERALRSGGVDRVIVLARWNGHAAFRRIVRLCRGQGVPVVVVP